MAGSQGTGESALPLRPGPRPVGGWGRSAAGPGHMQAVGVPQRRGQRAASALGQQEDAQQGEHREGGEDHVVQEEAAPAVHVGQGRCGLAQEAGPQHEA